MEAGGALIHKSRVRPASNKVGSGVRELVLELVGQNYGDFGPTLAAEVLLERHGIDVSRETLRRWMVEAGVWLSRKQRRSFHQALCGRSREAAPDQSCLLLVQRRQIRSRPATRPTRDGHPSRAPNSSHLPSMSCELQASDSDEYHAQCPSADGELARFGRDVDLTLETPFETLPCNCNAETQKRAAIEAALSP